MKPDSADPAGATDDHEIIFSLNSRPFRPFVFTHPVVGLCLAPGRKPRPAAILSP
jgi:hypothetical protein